MLHVFNSFSLINSYLLSFLSTLKKKSDRLRIPSSVLQLGWRKHRNILERDS